MSLCLLFLFEDLETLEGAFEKKKKNLYPSWNSLVAQTVKHLSTMWETRVWSLGWEDPLEKEMAIHSSTLAWKIPWTEEPGRLQSMGREESDTTERLHVHVSWKSHQVSHCWDAWLYPFTVWGTESAYKGKTTPIHQGEMVLPHASQTSERYRDHFTAQAFTQNKKPSLNWLLLISQQIWYKSHLWNTARFCLQGYLHLTGERTDLDSLVSPSLFHCQKWLGCPSGLFPRCGCGNSVVSSWSLWKAMGSLLKHCCHFKCDLLVVTDMYLLV